MVAVLIQQMVLITLVVLTELLNDLHDILIDEVCAADQYRLPADQQYI